MPEDGSGSHDDVGSHDAGPIELDSHSGEESSEDYSEDSYDPVADRLAKEEKYDE